MFSLYFQVIVWTLRCHSRGSGSRSSGKLICLSDHVGPIVKSVRPWADLLHLGWWAYSPHLGWWADLNQLGWWVDLNQLEWWVDLNQLGWWADLNQLEKEKKSSLHLSHLRRRLQLHPLMTLHCPFICLRLSYRKPVRVDNI